MYFDIDDNARYELESGILQLREMTNHNQPTHEHKNSSETIQQMANNTLAYQGQLDEYYAYQEATIDTKRDEPNVGVSDVLI